MHEKETELKEERIWEEEEGSGRTVYPCFSLFLALFMFFPLLLHFVVIYATLCDNNKS